MGTLRRRQANLVRHGGDKTEQLDLVWLRYSGGEQNSLRSEASHTMRVLFSESIVTMSIKEKPYSAVC